METSRRFNLDELRQFDGKNGRPAYVAYAGKVYDVTDTYLWVDGEHMGMHQAGKNLTQEMADSPHGDRALDNMKLIGVLVQS